MATQTIYRNRWAEFATGFGGINFRLALGGYFDPRPLLSICLGWGRLYLHLPYRTRYDECDPPEYGFYYHSGSLWFKFGRKTKSLSLPWDMRFIRLSKLLADGVTWDTEYSGKNRRFWDQDAWPAGYFWKATYPYTYALKSGEVQQRTATVKVEEREWRPFGAPFNGRSPSGVVAAVLAYVSQGR